MFLQHVVEEKALPGGLVLLTLIYCTVSSFSVEVSSFPSPSLSSLFVMSQWHNKIFQQTNNVCQTCPEKSLVHHFHLQFVSFRCVPSSTTKGFERHQVQLSNPIHYHLMIAAGWILLLDSYNQSWNKRHRMNCECCRPGHSLTVNYLHLTSCWKFLCVISLPSCIHFSLERWENKNENLKFGRTI